MLVAGCISGSHCVASGHDFVHEGVYYEKTGEMHVRVVANPTSEKYSGKLTIPQYFNITTYGPDGSAIINSYFVTEVGASAFEGCEELRSISLPDAVMTFGDNAFKGCTGLRDFYFPNSPFSELNLGKNAFEGCSSIYDIIIGPRVGSIGEGCFAGCSGLKEFTISAPEPPAIATGVFDEAVLRGARLYVPKSALGAYRAASVWQSFGSITALSDYSFCQDGVYYLIDDMNPKRVKVTFDGEGSYTGDVVIPKVVVNNSTPYTVTEIGRDAFKGSAGLTSVSMPESIVHLGVNAFEGCSGLSSITIPVGIGALPTELFKGCTGLKSIELPDDVAKLDIGVFDGCSGLETVRFSPNIYLIGAFSFRGCSSLAEVELPAALTTVGVNAFQNCTSLEKVVFGEKVSSILEYSFAGCSSLKSVESLNPEPPRLIDTAFDGQTYETALLTVPAGLEEVYRTSTHGTDNPRPDGWRNFRRINDTDGATAPVTEREAVSVDGRTVTADGGVEVFDLAGRRVGRGTSVTLPAAGAYIVRTGFGTSKLMVK